MVLIEAQRQFFRRNKEISLIGHYWSYMPLNIIDANVDAHLMQYNVDDNLSLAPRYQFNALDKSSNELD